MPVSQVLSTHDSADIAEWMAFDSLKDPEFIKKIEHQHALEQSRQMTDEERADAFKKLLRGQ